MGAPPFKRVTAPNLTSAGPETTLKRAEVVDLVAMRIPLTRGDDATTMRNKISSRISYDVRKGKLLPIARNVFQLGDIVRWGNERWPGRFAGLPIASRRVTEELNSGATVSSGVAALVVPGDHDRCREALRAASAHQEQVEGQLRDARIEADVFRAKALCWDNWNNKKGRRRRPQGEMN